MGRSQIWEEQVPESVDISDNEISSTKDNNRDNGQGPTTDNNKEAIGLRAQLSM